MALVGVFAHDPLSCKILRCVEAIWIGEPREVFFYYDILLDNSDETKVSVDSLYFYYCVDLTGDTSFKNPEGVLFDSDLSNSFYLKIPENRFLEKIDQEKRVIDRRSPPSSGWLVPKRLKITRIKLYEQRDSICGSKITIAFQPPIKPGERCNFRLLFKLGTNTSPPHYINVSTRRWSGVYIHNLVLRGFDWFALGQANPTASEMSPLPIDEYMLLAILPPDAEDLEVSPSPDSMPSHSFQMLSSEPGPLRQVAEWRVKPGLKKPLRVRVKYVTPQKLGLEFAIILVSMLVALASLAIGIWLLLSR